MVPLPPAARKLPYNKGLEALVVVPKGLPLAGTLIAISERGLDADGNIIGFLIGGQTPGQFSVRRTDNFDISDAVLLPSGDLLMLERKFSWLAGIGIRIRRIALASDRARRRGRRPVRSSTPISATRSTTWKASTPMSRRKATPC